MPLNNEWMTEYKDRIGTAAQAIAMIRPGNDIFIGSACGQPQYLVEALVQHSAHIHDVRIMQLLTMGTAPYLQKEYLDKFKLNTFFVAEGVRDALAKGYVDYSPIFLSEIPQEFESGRMPVDVALISVGPPDKRGLCSLGVSVDIVKAATENAKYVIAQVNSNMPRTLGNSFIHVNQIDMMVPHDEPIIEIPPAKLDDRLRRIGENVARLIEDGSTIECGIGTVPQAVAEFLKDKKDLGIHTEMFGDWIIDLMECGAVTGAKKTVSRGQGRRQLRHGLRTALQVHPQQQYVRLPADGIR